MPDQRDLMMGNMIQNAQAPVDESLMASEAPPEAMPTEQAEPGEEMSEEQLMRAEEIAIIESEIDEAKQNFIDGELTSLEEFAEKLIEVADNILSSQPAKIEDIIDEEMQVEEE